MRMDHYIKTSNNNIHMANILYALVVIGVVVSALILLLGRNLRNDFASIELIKNARRE